MTIYLQLSAIFAFGLVISGIVFAGVVRAREHDPRVEREILFPGQLVVEL